MLAQQGGMRRGDAVRRDPSRSVLNRVLREHLETFLARFTDEHGGPWLHGGSTTLVSPRFDLTGVNAATLA